MIRPPPRLPRPATLWPYTTLVLSGAAQQRGRHPPEGEPRRRSNRDARRAGGRRRVARRRTQPRPPARRSHPAKITGFSLRRSLIRLSPESAPALRPKEDAPAVGGRGIDVGRSEEHPSELQSLMRISYAVFGLKKKNNSKQHTKKL